MIINISEMIFLLQEHIE